MAVILQRPTGKFPPLGAKGATHADIISNTLELGLKHIEVAKQSKFYQELMVNFAVADVIRKCNGTLGLGGNFKNGCLYREKGLAVRWDKKNDGRVICDHAVPVTELVSQYRKDNVPLKQLIFSPVVRIKEESNRKLTESGLAKKWKKEWEQYPLSRYAEQGLSIVTHKGDEIDAIKWANEDHWKLVFNTVELKDVLEGLNLTIDQILKV